MHSLRRTPASFAVSRVPVAPPQRLSPLSSSPLHMSKVPTRRTHLFARRRPTDVNAQFCPFPTRAQKCHQWMRRSENDPHATSAERATSRLLNERAFVVLKGPSDLAQTGGVHANDSPEEAYSLIEFQNLAILQGDDVKNLIGILRLIPRNSSDSCIEILTADGSANVSQ